MCSAERLIAAALGGALVLAPGSAGAADSEYPLSFVERPLTLPRLTLAPELELDLNRLGVSVLSATGVATADAVLAGMQVGATFGVTDNLEVGALVLPLQFTNPVGYGGLFVGEEKSGNPGVFATYRFLRLRGVDLGARLLVQVLTPQPGLGAGVLIEPSAPLLLHIGRIARLDAEVGIPIGVRGGTTTRVGTTTVQTSSSGFVGLDVPVRLAVDIVEPFHVGASTGVHVDDFGHPGESTSIPLGVFAGYAIGGRRPLVDVDAFFSFVDFFTPGGGPFGDRLNGGLFITGVSAKGYVYF